jgi:hypothetical protein
VIFLDGWWGERNSAANRSHFKNFPTRQSLQMHASSIHFMNNLYISLRSEEQSKEMDSWEIDQVQPDQYISIQHASNATHSDTSTMREVIGFCERLHSLIENNTMNGKVIICPADNEQQSIIDAWFYLGAYLILYTGAKCEDVLTACISDEMLTNIREKSSDNKASTLDKWRALDRSMQLGWLVLPDSDSEPVMDVEEFAHYSQRANGMVHMTVPGKLFFFPTPEDLPSNLQWADTIAEDSTTVRRFSAHFYADLFEDLSVSVVACLGTGSAATAAVLRVRGVGAVDLGLAGDGSSLLRGLDTLLSLARAAPGAVALHSGDGFVWPGYVGTLVEAFLISRLGFDEGSAEAWLRMVSPWMLQ